MPGPRTVRAFMKSRGTTSHLASSPKPPAWLGVCEESREEALKIYQYGFGGGKNEANFYFNGEADTLYFCPCQRSFAPGVIDLSIRKFLNDADSISLDRVQFIALESRLQSLRGDWLLKFRKLQHLSEVVVYELWQKEWLRRRTQDHLEREKVERILLEFWEKHVFDLMEKKLKIEGPDLSWKRPTSSIEWPDESLW